MRRGLFFVILTVLMLSLVACNGEDSKNIKANTISSATLTEREETLLSGTADQSFVFDFNAGDQYKEVAVWVEKYESGKLVRKLTQMSTEIKNTGTMVFSTAKINEENNQTRFSISVHSNETTTTGTSSETIKDDNLGMVLGNNPSESISIKDKSIVLASIGYSSSEKGISDLSTDFYSDMGSHMDELKNFDTVYLLRCTFK
ncbi:hypothetical protein [Priestia endophytica]|uniref:Lipoprotein n=1 Tax=Priestia endophytica DSM 13796 TaxID=1121089 RepID=A0A1I5YQ58_9BACI|nr:hypothetical protein [Priestia endophytica]KYG33616.1 hypothetical protein AZF06_21055 [Priestia endophytica]SFQ46336.1 hypothetical protein SAMN02745910_01477 [Priestia endophytica DSM 13796]